MFGIFKKREPTPGAPAEQIAGEASPEDYANAQLIQQKAQVGAWIAKRFADPDEDQADTLKKYKLLREELLRVLDKIEDEFVRGFATHMMIKMAVSANDFAVAHALLTGVRLEFIRDQIRADYDPDA